MSGLRFPRAPQTTNTGQPAHPNESVSSHQHAGTSEHPLGLTHPLGLLLRLLSSRWQSTAKIHAAPLETVQAAQEIDRKSTRLNSSHVSISYAVFCLKKKKTTT